MKSTNNFDRSQYNAAQLNVVLGYYAQSEALATEAQAISSWKHPLQAMKTGWVAIRCDLEGHDAADTSVPKIPYAAAVKDYDRNYAAAWEQNNAMTAPVAPLVEVQ